MNRKAFTLIELLVVIAIIAILAAILFPVFSQAKEAAKKTRALAQMKQLSMGVMLYAGDYDDFFVPASNRNVPPGQDPTVWPPLVNVYVKNQEIFLAPGANGSTFAADWSSRRNQSIGYSDATGVDPASTAVEGAAPAGTEGFTNAANFSQADETARVGLFATTPNSTAGKERGYVFNPYNGPNSPDGDYKKGLPLIADVNLCTTIYKGNNYTGLSAGALKPIYALYGATRNGEGTTPVIFADGHAKSYSANALNEFGKVIWRFR
jgi:prepilin-type N-terminal cleavage/methylation domain-containing protein